MTKVSSEKYYHGTEKVREGSEKQLLERDGRLGNLRIFDSGLTTPVIKKLLRFKITRLSGLLKMDEDGLMIMAYHNRLRRKEIHQIKEYIHAYFPERFSEEFVLLPETALA